MGVGIYTNEFKDGAARQVTEGGHPVKEVASRLGCSEKSHYTWLRERKKKAKTSKATDNVDSLRDEVSRLKVELKRTKEERDILKKTAAYFAKASKYGTRSSRIIGPCSKYQRYAGFFGCIEADFTPGSESSTRLEPSRIKDLSRSSGKPRPKATEAMVVAESARISANRVNAAARIVSRGS